MKVPISDNECKYKKGKFGTTLAAITKTADISNWTAEPLSGRATADDLTMMFEACDTHSHLRTCNMTQKHECVISHAHFRTCTLTHGIGHPDTVVKGAMVCKTIEEGGCIRCMNECCITVITWRSYFVL